MPCAWAASSASAICLAMCSASWMSRGPATIRGDRFGPSTSAVHGPVHDNRRRLQRGRRPSAFHDGEGVSDHLHRPVHMTGDDGACRIVNSVGSGGTSSARSKVSATTPTIVALVGPRGTARPTALPSGHSAAARALTTTSRNGRSPSARGRPASIALPTTSKYPGVTVFISTGCPRPAPDRAVPAIEPSTMAPVAAARNVGDLPEPGDRHGQRQQQTDGAGACQDSTMKPGRRTGGEPAIRIRPANPA
jgi:hypothetical protein